MKNLIIFLFVLALSCNNEKKEGDIPAENPQTSLSAKYAPFKLTTDLSVLRASDKAVIKELIKAADIMNNLFWYEAFGERSELFAQVTESDLVTYASINYGPWDRLNNNEAFIPGYDAKPLGANFYPTDMTKEEFETADLPNKKSLYTFLRRDADNKLITIPYHEQFADELNKAAFHLAKAAEMTEDPEFKTYLEKRAKALLDDEYQESDLAWLDMKNNALDVVIGPIENYEDQLFGYKAAHEAYVLVKDQEWSKKLEHFAQFLPDLQKGLPVGDEYKAEEPGSDVQLNAYDVIYYAGDCNAGSKTIAINLPNDEEVQLKKGTRRLQLKNAMRAKFDKILLPISKELIVEEQQSHISFDAFFSNTMFHEVAHGLGIKNTINDKGTVREALKEVYSALEEGKADILGLYMIEQLHQRGELQEDLEDFQVTFMAGIFRSVRFGASSAHGKANMIRFNYFQEKGAFEKLPSGKYKVNFEALTEATASLSKIILEIQGNGDYEGCKDLVEKYGVIGSELAGDLQKLNDLGIPVDIVFDQGVKTLGI